MPAPLYKRDGATASTHTRRRRLILLITGALCLLLATSCGTKRDSQPTRQDQILFSNAEKAFDTKQYTSAQRLYGELVDRYPKASFTPAAMLKLGMILGNLKRVTEADALFERLATDYPMSPYVPLAMIESLNLSYRMGDFPGVIKKGVQIPDTLSPSDYRVRKYAIMGDAYLALGDRVDAVEAYFTSLDLALPAEMTSIATHLQKVVGVLTLEETQEMLSRVHDKEKRGYLLFQRVVLLAGNGKRDDALQGVNDLLTLYSDHPVREAASSFREAISAYQYNPKIIGCLLPFTGRYAEYGRQAREGIELAYQEAVRLTGIQDFQILFRDTRSDDEATTLAVRELVEAGSAAIIGPVGNVESAAAEAQLRGVPILTMTGKEGIASTGDFVFRNFMTRRMQVKTVVAYAFEVLGVNDVAILYPDEPYGRDFINLFWDEVNRYGGEVRGVESYKAGTKDFSEAIKKITGQYYSGREVKGDNAWGRVIKKSEGDAQKPVVDFEAIFIPDGADNLQLILPQLAFHDLSSIYALGTNLWHSSKLMKVASKQLGSSIIPDGFFARSRKPRVMRFVKSFKRVYDRTPVYMEAISYDSALLVFSTLAKSKPQSRAQLRDALLSGHDFLGVTGAIAFDEHGESHRNLTLLKGRGRRFVEVSR